MTQPLTAALEEAGRQIRDGLAEMAFQLTAQGALGALLRDNTERSSDQARTRLTHLADLQLERVSTAARQLTTLVDGILEDRETSTESTQDTKTPTPATGRAGSLARSGEGGS